jgi:hypothetical protein
MDDFTDGCLRGRETKQRPAGLPVRAATAIAAMGPLAGLYFNFNIFNNETSIESHRAGAGTVTRT